MDGRCWPGAQALTVCVAKTGCRTASPRRVVGHRQDESLQGRLRDLDAGALGEPLLHASGEGDVGHATVCDGLSSDWADWAAAADALLKLLPLKGVPVAAHDRVAHDGEADGAAECARNRIAEELNGRAHQLALAQILWLVYVKAGPSALSSALRPGLCIWLCVLWRDRGAD